MLAWGSLLNQEDKIAEDVLEQSQILESSWDELTRKNSTLFCKLFLPIIAIFSIINITSGYTHIGQLEVILFTTGIATYLLRWRISANMLAQICVAHITILSGAFLFLPALGESAYLWAIGLPFFTSYLVGSRATLLWSAVFLVVCTAIGYWLAIQGINLYWPWDMAPYLALPYLVMTTFAWFFAKYVEKYVGKVKKAELKRQKDAVALEESETRYRTLLQSSLNAVGVHRLGKWVYANPACLKVFGAEHVSQLYDNPILDFVHSDSRDMVTKRINEMTESKKNTPVMEEKFLRVNGEEFPVEVSSTPIVFDGHESFMITVKDMSERKKHESEQLSLQQQLEHSQRLESLGVLAGGIAHDFNNLLAAISGNAELVRLEIDDFPVAVKYMNHIDESCGHAADLCRQMLAYAGKGKYVSEAIDVNALVKSMSRLIRASVSSNVSLKVKLDVQLPLIEGDSSQIQQIILNFIVNSAAAIGEQQPGEIKITTGTTLLNKKMLGSIYNGINLDTGKYVVFEVKDSGGGMSEEIKNHIFDPFFTTKGNQGSGLGLSAVLGIVSTHKGGIRLESELGKGTVFQVFMPISSKTSAIEMIDTSEVDQWTGEGLVLIVDDDESVREVAEAFASKLHFDAIVAVDGQEGVDAFRNHHQKLKAVLLDMTMPKLSGLDAMRTMRSINDSVPIVIISGYGETESGDLVDDNQPDAFVQKPFRLKDIKKVLYKVTKKS